VPVLSQYASDGRLLTLLQTSYSYFVPGTGISLDRHIALATWCKRSRVMRPQPRPIDRLVRWKRDSVQNVVEPGKTLDPIWATIIVDLWVHRYPDTT
jgi:hypothetical protein